MGLLYDFEIILRAARDCAQNAKKRQAGGTSGTVDLFLCIVDHFEPQVGGVKAAAARKRLEDWTIRYPQIADRHRDADGRKPAHSFFYPWDEYNSGEFADLQDLCKAGYGETELHLHHRDDTEATLRCKFEEAIDVYCGQGALSRRPDGTPAFAFIHGNWALDNSRRDGGRNYCGVNSEIRLLAEMGCYADFTFPAWRHTAQPRLTNAIYYATDDPKRPKSHESGVRARAGRSGAGDLLLVQGPLVPFGQRFGGIARPAMDDGDLAVYRRYRPERLDRWVRAGIHVEGRGDQVFVKLHCHGAADASREALLGGDLDRLFTDAEARFNDGKRFRLHYVTAREIVNVVRAAENQPELPAACARDSWLRRGYDAAQ